jgi:anti-sigma-K factor RskA
MTHETEELACLYVLDQLDDDERARFEARLLREPELAAFVRSLDPLLAGGIDSLPRLEPPAGTLDRIEARLDWMRLGERAAEARARPASRRRFDWSIFARWGLASVIAVSLATLAVQSVRNGPTGAPVVVFVGLDQDRNTIAEVPLQTNGTDPDARFMQLALLAKDFWQKPAARPVAARSAGDRAYALFDPASRQGFIAVEQLPPAPGGSRYHLWVLCTESRTPIDAGELPLDDANRGFYSFSLAPEKSPASERLEFFITVEPASDSPTSAKPQGKVVLGRTSI